jgi:hypothetical protein
VTAPPTTVGVPVPATVAAAVPNQGPIRPDVVARSPRPLLEEPMPVPMSGDRSVFQSVIYSTSGPIGRRLVALAGVAIAVLLGILAASIDQRTDLVRRIQQRRHIDGR